MIRGLAAIAIGLIIAVHASKANAASIVTEWLDQALPYAQEVAWEPTVGSRFFAILHTAMYDAWTAYDPAAVGVISGTTLKGQGGADNEANKREAISHAAFTVLRTLAPQHRHALIERMQALGYDPDADTLPAKVGRRAAVAVLANRRYDGANEVRQLRRYDRLPTTNVGSAGRVATDRTRWESASFQRPRNGAASCPSRWRAPINSVPFRRRPPELPNGRGKLTY